MIPGLRLIGGDGAEAPGSAVSMIRGYAEPEGVRILKERVEGISDATARHLYSFILATAERKFSMPSPPTAFKVWERGRQVSHDVAQVLGWPAEDLTGYAEEVEKALAQYLAQEPEGSPEVFFAMLRQGRLRFEAADRAIVA
jgi:hypothetical protein